MLDTAITALGSSFSPRFMLGQFFPVFTVLVVNLLFGCLYFLGWNASLDLLATKLQIGDFATGIGVVAFVACVVAFTLAPMINAMRRLLAGDLLLDRIRASLIDANKRWAGKLQAEIGQIALYGESLRKARDEAMAALQLAAGNANRDPAAAAESADGSTVQAGEQDPGSLEHASAPRSPWWKALVLRLGLRRDSPAPQAAPALAPGPTPSPSPEAAIAALVDLEARLRDADAASVRARWRSEAGRAVIKAIGVARKALASFKEKLEGRRDGRFDAMLIRFRGALDGALAVASRLQSDRRTALQLAYVPSDPQPTRFGNLTAACEHYPMAAYGAGYEFIWPRVQLAIPKDDDNWTLLAEARTQLEYAVLAMLLAMLSCLAWLTILLLTDTSGLRFLLVGLGSWLGFHLFYRVTLEAQRNLTQIIKSMLDYYRWNLLVALHVEKPSDSEAERALWRSLQSISAGIQLPTPLAYKADS
jgi:hypothetical protein